MYLLTHDYSNVGTYGTYRTIGGPVPTHPLRKVRYMHPIMLHRGHLYPYRISDMKPFKMKSYLSWITQKSKHTWENKINLHPLYENCSSLNFLGDARPSLVQSVQAGLYYCKRRVGHQCTWISPKNSKLSCQSGCPAV